MNDSEKLHKLGNMAKHVTKDKTGNPMVFLAEMVKLLNSDDSKPIFEESL